MSLLKFIPDDDLLIDQLSHIGYSNKNPKFKNSSNKKIINYILLKLENSYDVQGELELNCISSIEYIMGDDEEKDCTAYIDNLLPFSKKLIII